MTTREATREAEWPHVGMVVPPRAGEVPREAPLLYPSGVRFLARGLGVKDLSPPSYDSALERLDIAVDELIAAGADAVSLMGTSISFYRGSAGHDAVHRRVAERVGGRPASTMALAIVRALRAVGAERIVVGSPYSSVVAAALVDFLAAHGFRVEGERHLGLIGIGAIRALDDDALFDLGDGLVSEHPSTDAFVLSCGALHTTAVTERLESRWRVPVISSSQAGCWDAVGLLAPELAGSPSRVR